MGIRWSCGKRSASKLNDGQSDRSSRLLVLQATQRVIHESLNDGQYRYNRQGTSYENANCKRLENCIRSIVAGVTCPVTLTLNVRRLKDISASDDFFCPIALRHFESCAQVQTNAVYRVLIRNDESIRKKCQLMIRTMPMPVHEVCELDMCHVCEVTMWETRKHVLTKQFQCHTPVAWGFYLYSIYEVVAAGDERRFWTDMVPIFNDSKPHAQMARELFLSDVSQTQFEHALSSSGSDLPSVLINLILMYDVVHSRQAAMKRLLDCSQFKPCLHTQDIIANRKEQSSKRTNAD